jgi:MOSC domain-containing protein YiiM
MTITIQAIFIGQPQQHTDERGEWRSSIYRAPVNGPIFLGERALAGDEVTDTKHHGSPAQAVCCHDQSHYDYWNEVYALHGDARLGPGSLGENWTLTGAPEAALCVGDVYRVGQAVIQVTAPRYPCGKQERKLRLPNFVQRSKETMRTGFYLGVLQTGLVAAGEAWVLQARPQPEFSLERINQVILKNAPLDLVARVLALPELDEGSKKMIRELYH